MGQLQGAEALQFFGYVYQRVEIQILLELGQVLQVLGEVQQVVLAVQDEARFFVVEGQRLESEF